MNMKTKALVCAAMFAVLSAFTQYAAVHACGIDEFYLTKEITLAGSNPEVLNEAIASAQTDQAKIDSLVRAGSVIQIKEGTKVQVTERSFEWKMLKIKLPEGTSSYWVKDGSLKQIDCK